MMIILYLDTGTGLSYNIFIIFSRFRIDEGITRF